MSKAHRQPVKEGNHKETKTIRRGIGQQLRMDMTPYNDAYPNKQLMLINDMDGDVQRWLDAGAEPIPSKIAGRKEYKGLNDREDNEWVRFVGGQTKQGETFWVYGLMMDPDLYDEYKNAPNRQRQADIKKAMGAGHSEESGALAGGGSVQTYAANLPTGAGQGYNQIVKN